MLSKPTAMLVIRAFIRRARWAALVCCVSLEARAQSKAPSPRSLSVEYAAAEGCPDRDAFVAAILARAPSATLVPADSAAISLRVAVSGEGRSTLWIGLENGSSRREVEGASCQDAVASMALIAAMVVEADPELRISTADTAGGQSPASGADSPKDQPETAPVPPPPLVTGRAPADPASRARQPPPEPTGRWGALATLGLTTESAVAGTPPLGLAAGAELGRDSMGNWGLLARAEAIATLPQKEQGAGGSAQLHVLAGRLSACTPRRLSPRLRLTPCLTLDLGRLYAGGQDVPGAENATMPWLALGLLLRASFEVASTWGIEAALGAKRLARHDRFYFRPNSTAYEVPAYSAGATLGLNFRIF